MVSARPRPSTAPARARRSCASSALRPNSGVGSSATDSSFERTTRYASTVCAFPLSTNAPNDSNSKARPASRNVVEPTTISPGVAIDSSRCAVFTVSPTTVYADCTSPASRPLTTSPLEIPIRRASRRPCSRSSQSFSSASALCISTAARTARSASSSWETGAPKTAMTASPMYFSTVPSYRWIGRTSAAKNAPRIRRRSSGSSRSPRGVDPDRSAKSTETNRRSSCKSTSGETWRAGPPDATGSSPGVVGEPPGAPQFGQNRCVRSNGAPHAAHLGSTESVVALRGQSRQQRLAAFSRLGRTDERDVASPLDDVSPGREPRQRPIHVLPAGRYHAGQRPLRQTHIDPDALRRFLAVLGRQVEKLPRDPAGDVEESGFGEGLVHAPDVAAEHLDQMPDGLRIVLEESHDRLPLQRDAPGRHHRLGIHRPHRLVFEEGQLAEAVAGKEHGEDRLRAAAPHSGDFHLPANDDVEDCSRVTLVKDVGGRRVAPHPDCRRQLLELLNRNPLEQHRPGEDRHQVHGGMICRFQAMVPNSTGCLCRLT